MTKAKFGVRLTTFPLSESDVPDFVDQVLRFLREVEQSYDSAWISDHFFPGVGFMPRTAPNLEGFVTMSFLSGIFNDLMWGNIVLCNSYRNPALLAKMGATLQTLTGGRVILGIGAGWKQDEYTAYGYEFPAPKVRIEQLEEAVQIIKKMWTEDAPTFKGRYYKIKGAICSPKPFPLPPIMIGGGGEKLTLRAVARHADWWNPPDVTHETLQHKMHVLEKHCDNVGRDSSEIVKVLAKTVAVAQTRDEADRIAAQSPFVGMGVQANYVKGAPDELIDEFLEYTELGVQYFILRFADFPKSDGAKLFAEEVIPALSSEKRSL